jgi:hypothetical protein
MCGGSRRMPRVTSSLQARPVAEERISQLGSSSHTGFHLLGEWSHSLLPLSIAARKGRDHVAVALVSIL